TGAVVLFRTRRWLRDVWNTENGPIHALLLTEAFAWILFRYLATGKRIAHIPTLFLEVVFVLFFVLLYWSFALFVARLATLLFGADPGATLERVAVSMSTFLLLPILALTPVPPPSAIVLALMVSIFTISQLRSRVSAVILRTLLAWVAIPVLLFVLSYAASGARTQWIDLFHRGESIGPASDYLRGKAPYRDVFVLHGMLEDGLLDAWLMEIFGRRVEVAATRAIVVSALTIPALWCLGVVLFESLPLAAVVALVSFMTYLENQRALLEIVVVALIIAGIRANGRIRIALAGVVASIALFFSLEIGIYSILAGATSLVLLRRNQLLPFLLGAIAGAAPFGLYLAARGTFGDFLTTSFVTVPRIIDATWSIPFPDLASWMQSDLTLPAIAGFILSQRIGYVLNPIVIGIALSYLLARWIRKPVTALDEALIVVALFALVTQRSALGRADFGHQYFSAFLVVPLLIALLVVAARQLAAIWRWGPRGAQALVVAISLVALPALFVSLWIPDLVNARLDSMIGFRIRRALNEPAGEVTRNRIGAVGTEIMRLTPPDAPIFDFSNQPAFYFFAARPNPTRFYQIPIASPLPFQIEAIRDLETAKPRVVLRRSPEGYDRFDGVENDLRAPALAAYLDDHYRFAKKVHGVELWTRVTGRRFELQRYVRAHRLPDSTTRLAREWSIFPAVGSLAGAAGAYWRSNLVIHNPHGESIALRLRYISTRGAFEKRLTIPPSFVAHYPDVVQGLFNASGSRGTLRIEHPVDRKPIMTVKTYDSSRMGRGTIERPLSLREAATAGTARDELTLAGVNGVGGNRL
ncbi:MAG TPA: hypothetical protein VIL97_01515, partial [Thermoanaerobaculia bacterium]